MWFKRSLLEVTKKLLNKLIEIHEDTHVEGENSIFFVMNTRRKNKVKAYWICVMPEFDETVIEGAEKKKAFVGKGGIK
jgi:hypothetical protein